MAEYFYFWYIKICSFLDGIKEGSEIILSDDFVWGAIKEPNNKKSPRMLESEEIEILRGVINDRKNKDQENIIEKRKLDKRQGPFWGPFVISFDSIKRKKVEIEELKKFQEGWFDQAKGLGKKER